MAEPHPGVPPCSGQPTPPPAPLLAGPPPGLASWRLPRASGQMAGPYPMAQPSFRPPEAPPWSGVTVPPPASTQMASPLPAPQPSIGLPPGWIWIGPPPASTPMAGSQSAAQPCIVLPPGSTIYTGPPPPSTLMDGSDQVAQTGIAPPLPPAAMGPLPAAPVYGPYSAEGPQTGPQTTTTGLRQSTTHPAQVSWTGTATEREWIVSAPTSTPMSGLVPGSPWTGSQTTTTGGSWAGSQEIVSPLLGEPQAGTELPTHSPVESESSLAVLRPMIASQPDDEEENMLLAILREESPFMGFLESNTAMPQDPSTTDSLRHVSESPLAESAATVKRKASSRPAGKAKKAKRTTKQASSNKNMDPITSTAINTKIANGSTISDEEKGFLLCNNSYSDVQEFPEILVLPEFDDKDGRRSKALKQRDKDFAFLSKEQWKRKRTEMKEEAEKQKSLVLNQTNLNQEEKDAKIKIIEENLQHKISYSQSKPSRNKNVLYQGYRRLMKYGEMFIAREKVRLEHMPTTSDTDIINCNNAVIYRYYTTLHQNLSGIDQFQ